MSEADIKIDFLVKGNFNLKMAIFSAKIILEGINLQDSICK